MDEVSGRQKYCSFGYSGNGMRDGLRNLQSGADTPKDETRRISAVVYLQAKAADLPVPGMAAAEVYL